MGSSPKSSVSRPMRRRPNSQRQRFHRAQKVSRTVVNGRGRRICSSPACSSVSDKLEALKNLIPAHSGEIKADQLFQETADYIVLLRTRVLILQRLIDFYGSSEDQNALQS
uniref:BHLH domain-containing protein n=1 Tax=Davidia involucrata TaxID=16924 RepID=A0A5B6ZTC9_DAVIN